MKLFQLKIVALFMLTIFGVKVNAKFKPVIASLSTKWKNTPIIHEARYGMSRPIIRASLLYR